MMELTTAEPKKSSRKVSSSRQKPKQAERTKVTIVLDADLDFRLGASAEFRKLNRSELAAILIDQGLRVTKFDQHLRQFTDSASETAELNLAG